MDTLLGKGDSLGIVLAVLIADETILSILSCFGLFIHLAVELQHKKPMYSVCVPE